VATAAVVGAPKPRFGTEFQRSTEARFCYPSRIGALTGCTGRGGEMCPFSGAWRRACRRVLRGQEESWHVVYLVIVFLVAAMGIARLWLQQRREQSQMDTIQGFNSALQAMSPPMAAAHRPAARSMGRPQRRVRRHGVIQGWFVARPTRADIERRVAAHRRAEARRKAHFNELRARRILSQRATSQYERYAG
jgi:hypothetical protein